MENELCEAEMRPMRHLALAVIARAIRDLGSKNPGEVRSAKRFLQWGAPGWAELAGISSGMIAEKYKPEEIEW